MREDRGSDESSWGAERLALALEAGRLGEWSWDATTDIMTMSPRAAEIYGVAPDAIVTRAVMREVLHPDDRERQRIAAEDAMTRGEDYAIEYRIGSDRWVSVTGRARRDARGDVVGMFGVVQDITNDRLLLQIDDAVRPLLASEEITFTAAQTLGRHLRVNRCAYAFVEADQDTFILTGNYNDGVESIVGTYRFRQFGAECLRLMRANEPWVVEDATVDPRLDDEDRKAYAFTAIRAVICVPIHKSGRFVAAMAVHTRTTRKWLRNEVTLLQQVASRCWESIERARVEREREGLLRAAESANRTKDEFLAMLGHELRNPLAPILTALQLMRLRGETASERERTVIERQVAHLTRLVDDLLDVSRIARGKVELERERVELADVCARAIEVASPLLEKREHRLEVQVPSTGLAVDGDVARLTQVISNLLTNAGKYTPPRGHILITGAVDGGDAVLTVHDDGIGMTAEVLPRVFELFVQGSQQSIDRAHGGLGLGLTIVKSLVERHGGHVIARSAGMNRGSELEVRLPLADPSAAAAAPSREASSVSAVPASRFTRVLIVDDNEDALELLGEALELRGCAVKRAPDGAAALRLAEAEVFDVALLDIGLPVMDGYELAARLRELPSARGTRLVAITGYGQENDRRRAFAAGFDEHLVKPVNLRAVDAILHEAKRTRPR